MDERGLLGAIEPNPHTVPHGDRSGAIIEPYLTDQWYVDAKTLAAPALAAVREGETNFVPKNWEKTYFDWLENIQPWCISRQLWWGHQIPAWYGPDGKIFVAFSEADASGGGASRHYGERKTLWTRDPTTSSTPGSPRRSGRFRRSAGRTRRRTEALLSDQRRSSPASTSSSSGSPA